MPWTEKDDLDKYKKGMTDKQKRKWIAVANNVLKNCDGDDCEARAIRIANGSVEESAVDEQLDEAKIVKTEDGQEFTSVDYAYVPDPEKPSTWKLRLSKTPGGGPDAGIVGAACAAIGAGFRGNKVEIPSADLPSVKSKLRAAWKKANPDKEIADMPDQIKESLESDNNLIGEINLIEKVAGEDGIFPIKIIRPGWGSSGYYPEKTLATDGPKVFTAGTKMYWDHPTQKEAEERPERSLRDLAGELVTDAVYKKDGLYGAGLYASAKVFEPFRAAVKELTPHIGVSIRATGIAEQGEADGQKGMIVEKITHAASVDFVTMPGAGGKVLELFESYRDPEQKKKEIEMAEIEELKESKTKLEGELAEKNRLLEEANKTASDASEALKKANESLLQKQAAEFVEKRLPAELPDETKQRLVGKLSVSPVVTEDGKIDETKFGELIDEAVKEEKEYLLAVAGSGKIFGMGESGAKDDVNLEESYKAHYLALGYSEEKAAQMAKISGGK